MSAAPARAWLGPDVLERIRERAARAYPEECCGLLIGTRTDERIDVRRERECANRAEPALRTRRFEIEPSEVIGTIRDLRGGEESLVGFYHSHPDAAAVPSRTDVTYQRMWPDTLWMIVPSGAEPRGDARGWWIPSIEPEGEPLEVPLAEGQWRNDTSLAARHTGPQGRAS